MRADVRSILDDVLSILEKDLADVLSILEKEMRAQQGSREQTLSDMFDTQFAAARILAQISPALPNQEEICRIVSERDNKPIDTLT